MVFFSTLKFYGLKYKPHQIFLSLTWKLSPSWHWFKQKSSVSGDLTAKCFDLIKIGTYTAELSLGLSPTYWFQSQVNSTPKYCTDANVSSLHWAEPINKNSYIKWTPIETQIHHIIIVWNDFIKQSLLPINKTKSNPQTTRECRQLFHQHAVIKHTHHNCRMYLVEQNPGVWLWSEQLYCLCRRQSNSASSNLTLNFDFIQKNGQQTKAGQTGWARVQNVWEWRIGWKTVSHVWPEYRREITISIKHRERWRHLSMQTRNSTKGATWVLGYRVQGFRIPSVVGKEVPAHVIEGRCKRKVDRLLEL